MNITIVGPGAIGSLWAIKLFQAGHSVSLWSRTQSSSISLSLDDSDAITFSNNNVSDLQAADLILFTVKAWQVENAATPLLKHIHKDAILMFMHNGMGALDKIEKIISTYPVMIATTTQAAFKPSTIQVKHTGLGETQLGAFNHLGNQCRFLVDVLNHALPNVTWNSKIQHALWNKLAINCAINPLTGLNQIKNGQLADSRHLEALNDISHELYLVMKAENVECELDALRSTITAVIQATANNNSSMKQDMYYQRKTEIDFITGYLIRKAEEHGIDVPVNRALYQSVKKQEQSWTD
ncbi:2-dehydropantoate 2-reductase [Vibrio profundi]|uniref:2-dehydropantoate 2-reductase n=1 Tax=Vibrio profundi TaxID=1774960 RepID=UPI003736CA51